MHFAVQITRVLFVAVEAAQRWWVIAAVGNGVPGANARLQAGRLEVGEEAGRQVVTKPLAHGSSLVAGPEARDLVVLDSMAVFVQNDLGVLRIIDAADTEPQRLG